MFTSDSRALVALTAPVPRQRQGARQGALADVRDPVDMTGMRHPEPGRAERPGSGWLPVGDQPTRGHWARECRSGPDLALRVWRRLLRSPDRRLLPVCLCGSTLIATTE